MKFLPRKRFDQIVEQEGVDKYNKGFTSWKMLSAMLYAQLSGVGSLRTLEASFNSQARANRCRLGLNVIRRSTLADALAKRCTRPFAEMAQFLMSGVSARLRREGKKLLYLLDSTSITLKGRGFEVGLKTIRPAVRKGLNCMF